MSGLSSLSNLGFNLLSLVDGIFSQFLMFFEGLSGQILF